jgi:hypothetical protein
MSASTDFVALCCEVVIHTEPPLQMPDHITLESLGVLEHWGG